MSQEDYTELNALIDAVAVQDVHLGRVLSAFASHLPGYSDAAKTQADADAAARDAAKAEAPAEPAPQEPFQAPVESEQTNAS